MSDQRRAIAVSVLASAFLLVVLAIAVNSREDDLDGTSWQMTSLVVDDAMTPAISGPEVMISFVEGSVRGFGGCNEFFGHVEAEGGSLSFGNLGSTTAICDDPAGTSDQELAFLSHLDSVDGYRIAGTTLVLTDGSNALVELEAVDETAG